MLYSDINSDNYDFLWTVGLPYLYCSMYLLSGYQSRDFVACQNGYSHTLFVSKKERKRLSKLGLKLYTTGFATYEVHIKKQLVIYDKIINKFYKQNIAQLNNHQLAQSYQKATKFCIEMWKNYFLTEYHSSDLVSQILAEKNREYNIKQLRLNAKKIGKLKYSQRQFINQTLYSPNIFEKYWVEIKKRLNLKYDINNYSFKELIDLLNGKKITIPNRTGDVARGKFSKWKDILGSDAKIIFEQLQKVEKDIKEFRGNIGNKGYYKGYVKMINFSVKTDFNKKIGEMKKGEVLVSGSTGPEMILACKKAGAIITDEGGIISHAAIVSRELGIPAIIGTKIATKVLHDGDLVEVDADKGVVRLRRKASADK